MWVVSPREAFVIGGGCIWAWNRWIWAEKRKLGQERKRTDFN